MNQKKEKCSDYELFLLPLREFKRNEDNFVGMSDKSFCDFYLKKKKIRDGTSVLFLKKKKKVFRFVYFEHFVSP